MSIDTQRHLKGDPSWENNRKIIRIPLLFSRNFDAFLKAIVSLNVPIVKQPAAAQQSTRHYKGPLAVETNNAFTLDGFPNKQKKVSVLIQRLLFVRT